jgi:ZIP family zinc transporter
VTLTPCCAGLSPGVLLLAVGAATGIATLAGGFLALRLRRVGGLVTALSAGAVIGVALFDLLPEALEAGRGVFTSLDLTAAVACGFAVYLLVDRAAGAAPGQRRGHFAAGALTLHSLMDGIGVGLAFQLSPAAGVIVAAAVLAHDMVDGVNTVTVSLAGGTGRPAARAWLIADALAPLVGIGLTRLVTVRPAPLSLALSAFTGFFLYIGAAELLPRSRNQAPGLGAALATAIGLGAIYLVVRLAGG